MEKIEKVKLFEDTVMPGTINGLIENTEELDTRFKTLEEKIEGSADGDGIKDIYGADGEETFTNKIWKGRQVYRRCYQKQSIEGMAHIILDFCHAENVLDYNVDISFYEKTSGKFKQRYKIPLVMYSFDGETLGAELVAYTMIESSLAGDETKNSISIVCMGGESFKEISTKYNAVVEYIKD